VSTELAAVTEEDVVFSSFDWQPAMESVIAPIRSAATNFVDFFIVSPCGD
jgi:hypothetical protein